MEDFLGGVGGTGSTTASVDHLGCGELGSIAAGFMHRYTAPGMPENPGAVTGAAPATDVVESDQARRPAETFGQRTSIYRGVTRY
jgi:AP2-like factor (ANT lineage)